jgi:hypothetical protein
LPWSKVARATLGAIFIGVVLASIIFRLDETGGLALRVAAKDPRLRWLRIGIACLVLAVVAASFVALLIAP